MGIKTGDDKKVIRARYLFLSKLYHPDKGGDPKNFIEMKACYDILMEPFNKKGEDSLKLPDTAIYFSFQLIKYLPMASLFFSLVLVIVW